MQRAIERRIPKRARRALCALSSLLLVAATAPAARAQDSASAVGVTRGRLTVSFAEYQECAIENSFVRAQQLMLTGGGFLPSEAVAVTLEQDGSELAVASVRATPRGGLSAIVAIPVSASTESEARLYARAEKGDVGGGVVLRSPPLRIFPEVRDSDGDGFQDHCDTCPAVASENLEDSDFDGLGDPCDECPNDADNDSDADGLCADVDPNPYAPEVPATQ
jgi:hypothetical protein